jgi:hypothetical protein
MALSICEVVTAREKDRFIKLPWQIYKHDANWVPPLLIERKAFLDPNKNPFFKNAQVKLFMAYNEKGKPLGRIAGIISENHLKTHNDGAGFFGLFECVNDQQTANLLFGEVASFLRAQGMRIMRGPMSMNINDEVGLLISGFDTPPVIMMSYNPPYYETLTETFGFKKEIDWYAYYRDDREGKVPERLRKGMELAKKRYKFSIRPINMKRFDEEVEKFHEVYTRAWEKNWGAVAFTKEEFYYLAKDLKMIVFPELTLLAEAEGKIIGVSLALPDINQILKRIKNGRLLPFGIIKLLWYKRKIDMIRLIIMGVIKEYRNMGVDICLIHDTYCNALKLGICRCEMSLILETNSLMNNGLTKMGAKVYKTYRIYDYKL